MADTKEHWKNIVTPEDLDFHLRVVGQASVNASLVKKMLLLHPLASGSTIYVPGCGTGQMFDYFNPTEIGRFEWLFSDYNGDLALRVHERLSKEIEFQVFVDDIENTKFTDKVDGALIVLLLQHINWRKALRNISRNEPKYIYCIIQDEDIYPQQESTRAELRSSIKKFSEVAETELIKESDLTSLLGSLTYKKVFQESVAVPESKRMVSLVYLKS